MITLVRKEKLKPSGFLLYWYCSIIEEDLHFGTSELIEDTPENRELLQEAWQYYLQHEDNVNYTEPKRF